MCGIISSGLIIYCVTLLPHFVCVYTVSQGLPNRLPGRPGQPR